MLLFGFRLVLLTQYSLQLQEDCKQAENCWGENTHIALSRKRTAALWPQAIILLGISVLKTLASSCAKQAADAQLGAASLQPFGI